MKRSEINEIMKSALLFIEKHSFKLPPFVYWTEKDWERKGHEYDEIRDNMLGWDITDFGLGDYKKTGLLMITLRNGSQKDSKYIKPYAEKLLISLEKQVTPYHFHWSKMEDIINRGGGDLIVKAYNATSDEKLDKTYPVTVYIDGLCKQVDAGNKIRIKPGESITIPSKQYHSFWAEGGAVLLGEVSKVNDDHIDNRFLDPGSRFPAIEEDEAKLYLLYNEYPKADN